MRLFQISEFEIINLDYVVSVEEESNRVWIRMVDNSELCMKDITLSEVLNAWKYEKNRLD